MKLIYKFMGIVLAVVLLSCSSTPDKHKSKVDLTALRKANPNGLYCIQRVTGEGKTTGKSERLSPAQVAFYEKYLGIRYLEGDRYGDYEMPITNADALAMLEAGQRINCVGMRRS